jgi:hypothetical protein
LFLSFPNVDFILVIRVDFSQSRFPLEFEDGPADDEPIDNLDRRQQGEATAEAEEATNVG